jgi:hypothetical protein
MTKVFVHGNPECDAVWNPLIEVLGGIARSASVAMISKKS